MNLDFARQILQKKYSDIKFHGNPSSGRAVVPYGRKDTASWESISAILRKSLKVKPILVKNAT